MLYSIKYIIQNGYFIKGNDIHQFHSSMLFPCKIISQNLPIIYRTFASLSFCTYKKLSVAVEGTPFMGLVLAVYLILCL